MALASTGNAGASMACAGAALGLEVVLFVPASAPRAKLLQSLLYGARVVPVRGTYDDAFALSIEYTRARGGVNRNTAFNPLTIEGKKTVSIEIWNQLGGRVPDVVYVPTGDGVIVAGVHKGFADLRRGRTRRSAAGAGRRAGVGQQRHRGELPLGARGRPRRDLDRRRFPLGGLPRERPHGPALPRASRAVARSRSTTRRSAGPSSR